MRCRSARAALLLLVLPGADAVAQAVFDDGFEDAAARRFFEPFTWLGHHASTIDAGNSQGEPDHRGTTVWWNEDAWDVGGDSSWNAIRMHPGLTGYHIDVHKAASADPREGTEANGVYVVGGDGSPGVAAMRMEFEGIHSARLRNPMQVTAARPGVVEFYAPKFVTTGHWWEIALTPAQGSVTSGTNTSVPAQVGRAPFEDSLNFVAIGYDDIPCDTGWYARFDVHRTLEGVTTEYPMAFPGIAPAGFPAIDPTQKMALTHWRLEFHVDRVELYADLDGNGQSEHVHHYPVGVPWPEVHVALLGVAYQADHHPQNCYQGLTRELVWRHVSVEPVRFARTSVAPRNTVTVNVQRETGWLGYDLRDIQRVGPAVDGVPQANAVTYEPWGHMAFTSRDLQLWNHARPPQAQVTLPVTLDASQAGAAATRLVYDIKDRGSATLRVNGTRVGTLPGVSSLRYAPQMSGPEPDAVALEWVRRSLDIPPGLLQAGANQLQIDFTGPVVMDRAQLEFGHAQ